MSCFYLPRWALLWFKACSNRKSLFFSLFVWQDLHWWEGISVDLEPLSTASSSWYPLTCWQLSRLAHDCQRPGFLCPLPSFWCVHTSGCAGLEESQLLREWARTSVYVRGGRRYAATGRKREGDGKGESSAMDVEGMFRPARNVCRC